MKTIKQQLTFNTSAPELYEILINPKKLSKIIGGKVSNDQKNGGKFSAYDDYIFGKNVELVPGKKIVQKWSCADFPEGHMTDLTIELKKITDKQTQVTMTQENVPDDFFEDISLGWNEFYWEPIKDWLLDLLWK